MPAMCACEGVLAICAGEGVLCEGVLCESMPAMCACEGCLWCVTEGMLVMVYCVKVFL